MQIKLFTIKRRYLDKFRSQNCIDMKIHTPIQYCDNITPYIYHLKKDHHLCQAWFQNESWTWRCVATGRAGERQACVWENSCGGTEYHWPGTTPSLEWRAAGIIGLEVTLDYTKGLLPEQYLSQLHSYTKLSMKSYKNLTTFFNKSRYI